MVPPSNSFVHAQHKMAEVLAGSQNKVTSAPPPPYVQTAPDADSNVSGAADLGLEDESPVTINIDASINVLGNGNTIIIPMAAGQASQPATTGTTSEAGASVPSTPAPSPAPATAATDATTILQSARKPRQAKLTEVAVSIISALQDSGRLVHRDSGSSEPIEININTAWKIKGDRNVICAGAKPGTSVKRSNASSENSDEEGGRKRRAQSEPLELPTAKKGRSL